MSREVKRYDHVGDYCGPQCGFEESEGGDWVRASDYDALLVEWDGLVKDAERYRWLAEHQAEEFPDFIVIHEYITDPDAQGCFSSDTYTSKSELDLAIDGAMQQP